VCEGFFSYGVVHKVHVLISAFNPLTTSCTGFHLHSSTCLVVKGLGKTARIQLTRDWLQNTGDAQTALLELSPVTCWWTL